MIIAVYCGSTTGNKEEYSRDAAAIGRWIAENGHELVYGGARSGLMGEVADSVLAGGGKVTGVLPDVDSIQARRHPGLTEYINTASMAERKQVMLDMADAYIALPGGPGTLDELSEVIDLGRLGIIQKPLVLLDTEGYYRPLQMFFQEMMASGFAGESDFDRILISNDMAEIAAFVVKTVK